MQQGPPDDIRRSRFALDPEYDPPTSRQSRAASQPPNSSGYYAAPPLDFGIASRRLESATSGSRVRDPSPSRWPPISRAQVSASRSVSFSEQPSSSNSLMAHLNRESRFASTFEDDEESLDEFDAFGQSQNLGNRRGDDLSRGRPQSVGTSTMRPRIASSPFQNQLGYPSNAVGSMQSSARYNPSLATGRIDTNVGPTSSRLAYDRFGYRTGVDDLSNMSPFVRDLNQIPFSDDGFRDVWGSGISGREDGGGSGATSRRHSVSVVQPRRGISVGFNAGGLDSGSPKSALSELPDGGFGSIRNGGGIGSYGGGGRGLMFSDDELASSLNTLNLNLEHEPSRTPRVMGPSQPSSLPTYAPHRSVGPPLDTGNSSRGIGLNLNIPAVNSHNPSSQSFASSRLESYSDTEHTQSPSTAERPPPLEHGLNEYKNGNGAGPAGFNDRYTPQRNTLGSPYVEGDLRRQQQPGASAAYNQFVDVPNDTVRHHQTSHNGAPPSPTTLRGVLPPPLSLQGLNRNTAYMASMSSPRSPTVPTYGGGVTSPVSINPYYPGINPPTQQPPHTHQHQRQASLPTDSNANINELGRGVPLHAVPPSSPLYIVEFKAGRTDIFYSTGGDLSLNGLRTGDLVIVEADRGKDLGRIINNSITPADVEAFQKQQAENAALHQQMMMNAGEDGMPPPTPKATKELMPKRIYAKASAQDAQLLMSKQADETKALQLCQSKVRAKKLPMEVVDAEYQWDRRKLTFYFIADRRIDFRELVRELFRLYKTRIWMACLQGPTAE
ncbi:PSP1 C-terminal conserved region-domain-containing protein [Cantharellus anzutake]|uniref:PSP1 C-terminal conserved region-domain-containing protein n=1 Tax=Cantharellus anzutake TaxID=1750568 RepID=UPI001908D208|nr:PSP1 C-terminal conserved region-domain-containing protein [Cantharellus anzutake]KAF8330349.1 PSP1 C-terminal conserved region-domain-containing protein [Cantharellus anzutake]